MEWKRKSKYGFVLILERYFVRYFQVSIIVRENSQNNESVNDNNENNNDDDDVDSDSDNDDDN